MKAYVICFLLVCVAVLPLAACNTVDGIGQDMSAAGRKVSGASH
jgi:predicted small secreted protein